jgi:hypothetical protein
MPCRYQKHAVQQDGRIRHLEQELKAASLEITKLKAVIGSSNIVKQAEVNEWIQPKIPKQGATGSLFMIPLNSNLETDSVCWKHTCWKLSSSVQVCRSKRIGESTQV